MTKSSTAFNLIIFDCLNILLVKSSTYNRNVKIQTDAGRSVVCHIQTLWYINLIIYLSAKLCFVLFFAIPHTLAQDSI